MKLLQGIIDFTATAINKLFEIVCLTRKKRSGQKDHEILRMRQQKRRGRRFNFASFKAKSSQRYSRLLRKQKKIRKNLIPTNILYVESSESSQKLDSQLSNCKQSEIITNQAVQGIEIQINFEDPFIYENGLQISSISNNGQSCNSEESDPQFLKFIQSDERELMKNVAQNQRVDTKSYKFVRKSWWVQAVQQQQQQSYLSGRISDAQEDNQIQSEDSQDDCKGMAYKAKRIKRTKIKKSSVRSNLKVIQMIDLTQDEDYPKLFQIPLFKSLTRSSQ